jgi:hypothetical protein
MTRKSNLTPAFAPAAKQGIGSRFRLVMLLAALGLPALAPTGASACGPLPAGVEPEGPVLRGDATAPNPQAQPIIVPHCYFTPNAGRPAVDASPDRSDKAAASNIDRSAQPHSTPQRGEPPETRRSSLSPRTH